MAVQLNRITAAISRAAEYFSAKELQAQTGQPATRFAAVVMKELADNALDAAEAAGKAPEVDIDTAEEGGVYRITVADNGPGIASETVQRILDFNVRVSDKSIYRSPTRGAQGNALKTLLGIPFALGCKLPVVIESQGVKHVISAGTDPAGNVRVTHREEPSTMTAGTKFVVPMPARDQEFCPEWWAEAFAVFNPHASVKIRVSEKNRSGNLACSIGLPEKAEFLPTAVFPGEWRKFLPTDLTSPWWYTEEALARLVFAHIAAVREGRVKDLTLRDFVRQFRGLTSTARAKAVCDRLSGVRRLTDLEKSPELVPVLLAAMKENTKPAGPEALGWCGEEHFRRRFEQLYGVQRYWYKRITGDVGGVPYVIEAAVAETRRDGSLFTGVNHSPTFEDPLASTEIGCEEFSSYGVAGFLNRASCHPFSMYEHVPCAVAFHLVCPALDFLDRAKTRLRVPEQIARDTAKALWSVCKTLYQEAKRRERDAARAARQAREREKALQRQEWTIKEVVFAVLPRALQKATGGGQYPVSARTLYYQVRPLMQEYIDKELDYNYFSQQLLTEYQESYGAIGLLYYDPRGYLYEPHTGRAVPLGTREIDAYDFPEWVFDKVLYVEKKGLWPVLQAAKLAERYDMAVVAAEGYATQAARLLFQRADRDREYRLFVLHDADPYGYNIARTLREETRRMKGYSVDVVDIGLKLDEAVEMGLQAEEFTRQQDIPQGVKENLSDLEKEYFVGRQASRKSWVCRRVELNAMSAPQLVAYIENKLAEHGATQKVLPPADTVAAFTEAVYVETLKNLAERQILDLLNVPEMVRRVLETAGGADFGGLREKLVAKLAANPPESWRELAEDEALRAAVKKLNQVNLKALLKAG
jgi:DNA topoisomerase VI subunit B